MENPYEVEHELVPPPPRAPSVTASGYCCVSCGYNLTGSTIGGVCPECGMGVAQSIQPSLTSGRTSQLALWSMILGIASLAVCAICGPIAIIFAAIARKNLKEGGFTSSSHGFATAGLVLGIVSTALNVLIWGIFGLMLMSGF